MKISRLLLLFTIIETMLHAQSFNTKALSDLALEKTWLMLIHYDQKVGESTILNNDFFLSDKGKSNPLEELRATIEGYDKPFSEDTNSHPRCRYPARYLWLSQNVPLKGYTPIPEECKRLSEWELPKIADSISVVFVSGFLGNPASAFGHSFIKVNKDSDHSMSNLMNTTISYGAVLPEKYTMTSYIMNGLTGGYQAKYSDKYYYMDEMVYSNSEFREMWEYELNLSSFQRELLLLHFWELSDQRFDYFFFTRNCGYKVSEMLELIYDEKVIDNIKPWYAPMETFHKLKEMNTENNVIKDIRYIPSTQQKVYAKYNGLTKIEKEIVETIINTSQTSIPTEYEHIATISKVKVMDFMLFFDQYKYTSEDTRTPQAIRERQDLIISRMSLPVLDYNDTLPPQKSPITQSVKTSYFGISGIQNKEEYSLTLRFSPFMIEKTGYNHLDGDKLSILDTELEIKEGKVSLRRLDLINIRRLKTQEIPFDTDNPFSWSLLMGTENYTQRDYLADGGIGYAWKFGSWIKFYMMLNASLHSTEGHYRYRPNIGFYGNFGKLRMNIEYSIEKDMEHIVDKKYYEADVQYKIGDSSSVYLKSSNKHKNTFEFGLKWYF